MVLVVVVGREKREEMEREGRRTASSSSWVGKDFSSFLKARKGAQKKLL